MLGLLLVVVVEANTYYIQDMLYLDVYGSKPHRIPCEKWPTPVEVQRILDEHSDIVHRIEAINPGFTMVEINTYDCPDRADIRILYATATDKEAIKSEVGNGEYFFGVPYQLYNK